jgi:hypothetical protein
LASTVRIRDSRFPDADTRLRLYGSFRKLAVVHSPQLKYPH